jgi:acetylornithine aminotransferase
MTGIAKRWADAVMPTYGTPGLMLREGHGARVTDADGKEYVDLVAGIAVNVLGHGHPAVVAAVIGQLTTLGHVSNLYVAEPPVALAERLLTLLGGRNGRVFFANSGAEANEAAFKLSRRTGRTSVVAAEGGFHGRTMGALALTGQPAKRTPFLPLPGEVRHVPFGDVAALDAAVSTDTAAVFLEPILGEGGVVPAPPGYLTAARGIATRSGALLVLDEVQTGIGRTGAWFAHQDVGVAPDVVTLAKGLGGGLPIGACIAFDGAADLLGPGQHGSTFGGNPVCCAAALAVLDVAAAEDLPGRAKRLGGKLRADIEALDHPLIAQVRGAGLMLGVVLREPLAKGVEDQLCTAGFLVNAVAPGVVRLVPPLVIAESDLDGLVAALPAALDAALGAAPGAAPGADSQGAVG